MGVDACLRCRCCKDVIEEYDGWRVRWCSSMFKYERVLL